MKNVEKKVYSAPEVEVIEVAVEQGFAASGVPDFERGNDWDW